MARTAFVAALVVFGFCLPADAQVTAFVNGRVIDGTGKVIEQGTVVVRDGKIAEVGPAASVRVPDGATRVELKGKTLMPGLINAHGHLSAVEYLRTAPELYNRANLERQLRAYATYGVTTRVLARRRSARRVRAARRAGDGAAGARPRLRRRPDRHRRPPPTRRAPRPTR